MRRMTKLMTAMVVMTYAMTIVPQQAEATLWTTLINLTDPSQPVSPAAPVRLSLVNNTGMTIRIELWTSNDEFIRSVTLPPGDDWQLRSSDWLDGNVEFDLLVYKPKRRQWHKHDTLVPPTTSLMIVDAVKWGKSDYGFYTLMVAR